MRNLPPFARTACDGSGILWQSFRKVTEAIRKLLYEVYSKQSLAKIIRRQIRSGHRPANWLRFWTCFQRQFVLKRYKQSNRIFKNSHTTISQYFFTIFLNAAIGSWHPEHAKKPASSDGFQYLWKSIRPLLAISWTSRPVLWCQSLYPPSQAPVGRIWLTSPECNNLMKWRGPSPSGSKIAAR